MSEQKNTDENLEKYIILVLKNISSDLSENKILDIMKKFGDVNKVYIPFDDILNRKKNYAFVEFCKIEDAMKAQIYLNGGQLDGLKVEAEVLHPDNYIKQE